MPFVFGLGFLAEYVTINHALVPGVLFIASCSFYLWRHFQKDKVAHPFESIWVMVLIQMLPLIALKMKLGACLDRMGLVPFLLVKTLLMHMSLFALRITAQAMQDFSMGRHRLSLYLTVDCVFLVCAVYVLRAFGLQPRNVPDLIQLSREHQDVRNLLLMAVSFAIAPFTILDRKLLGDLHLRDVLFEASNYVDIVAFMPIVWILYRADLYDDAKFGGVGTLLSVEVQGRVRTFLTFLCVFYAWEDIFDSFLSLRNDPMVMGLKGAHYILVLDFSQFFIRQVRASATGQGGKRKGFNEDGEQMHGLLDLEDGDESDLADPAGNQWD